MKISRLEIENVKRIKAVKLEPSASGLTVIGGRNNQGKTSVLDAIAWALGGEKHRPSSPQREGSVLPPNLHIVMDNGLVVERKGKNSALKVTDPSGAKAGQKLLDEFVEQLALDLPKFMEASDKEKAGILLNIIGVGDQLDALDREEKELYSERTAVGRIADQKAKYAAELPYFPDAPGEPVSPSELIREQQEILARNGENQRKRARVDELAGEAGLLYEKVKALKEQLAEAERKYSEVCRDLDTARTSAKDLEDESTAELEASIAGIDETNRKVRANLDKEKAEDDAKECRNDYTRLTDRIEDVRRKKTDLLKGARLPLPELGIEDGALTYKGRKWDGMSGSQRLMVAAAIVRELNPKCGFVLIDKLEQMDLETMQEFGAWLEAEGLQAIATRVSTGDECSIIIEDGMATGAAAAEETAFFTPKSWKGGF